MAVELADKRTLDSKTFINANGTYTTQLFTQPVHYAEDDGSLHEYNANIDHNTLSCESNELKVYFCPEFDDDLPIKTVLSRSGDGIEWQPLQLEYEDETGAVDIVSLTNASKAELQGNAIVYRDSYEGSVDDVFIVDYGQLKHNVILHKPPRLPEGLLGEEIYFCVTGAIAYTEDVEVSFWGMQMNVAQAVRMLSSIPEMRLAREQAAGRPATSLGSAEADATGFLTSKDIVLANKYTKEEVLRLPSPFAYEQGDPGARVDGEYRVSINQGFIYFSLRIPAYWLLMTERQWPVVIDPTVAAAIATKIVSMQVTMDPSKLGTATTLSNGNLTVTTADPHSGAYATVSRSTGKWYWEVAPISGSSNFLIGIAGASIPAAYPSSSPLALLYYNGGTYYNNGVSVTWGATYLAGDIIGVAADLGAGTLGMYKNNVYQGIIPLSIISFGAIVPCVGNLGGATSTINVNLGGTAFTYTPPAGYQSYSSPAYPYATYVASNAPSANYQSSTSLPIGTLDPALPSYNNGFMKFDVSAVPMGSKVLSAGLSDTVALVGGNSYGPNVCTGGTAIESGHDTTYIPDNAFNGDTITDMWSPVESTANQSGLSWLGYDFGVAAKNVGQVILYQGSGTQGVTSLKVQYSSDGSTWSPGVIISPTATAGAQAFNFPLSGPYRYWRILANMNLATGQRWLVYELQMMEAAPLTPTFTNVPFYADLVTQPWDPTTITWLNQPTVDTYWRITKPASSTDTTFTSDITKVVQRWADTGVNNGLRISANPITAGAFYFGPSPALSVTYYPVVMSKPQLIEYKGPVLNWTQYAGSGFTKYEIWKHSAPDFAYGLGTKVTEIGQSGVTTYTVTTDTVGSSSYYQAFTLTSMYNPAIYSANLCSGGAAIENNHNSGAIAANAFDGDTVSSSWNTFETAANQSGTSWVGYDFGAGITKHIRQIILYQFAGANGITSIKVQGSSDKITWSTGVIVSPTATVGAQTFAIAASNPYRYWRILANANCTNANAWAVYELQMMELGVTTITQLASNSIQVSIPAIYQQSTLNSDQATYTTTWDPGMLADHPTSHAVYVAPDTTVVAHPSIPVTIGGKQSAAIPVEIQNTYPYDLSLVRIDVQGLTAGDTAQLSLTQTPFTPLTLPYAYGRLATGAKFTVWIVVNPGLVTGGNKQFSLVVKGQQ